MDDHLSAAAAPPGKAYAMSGEIMLIAIVVLFGIITFLVGLHFYARWYLSRLHRRQPPRRRRRRTHIVFYADNHRSRAAAADRGLPLEVLKSLPVSVYSAAASASASAAAASECAVCLSEFEENEVVRHLPKCDHSFHIECIDMWFHSHSTCPLCRSAVEAAAATTRPAAVPAVEANASEPGSSSGSGLCTACQHDEGSGRRKAMGLRLEAAPPRRAELETELTQSSPGTRLLSLKRLLSLGKKSPVGGGGAPPHGAGTSHAAAELDLERGPEL